MDKVDWSKAPSDAEACIDGRFAKWIGSTEFCWIEDCWGEPRLNWSLRQYQSNHGKFNIEMRPDNWKEGEKRMELIGQNGKLSAYHRKVKGVWIDFYDIANAFDPENRNSADDHALKKMLLPGKRHTKGGIQDRKEAIQSIERAIELEDDK